MSNLLEIQGSFAALPHVLVVDDDVRILDLVSRYLIKHEFVVITAENTAEARAIMQDFTFDILVVDVMMPGETGLEFAQSFNGKEKRLPILLLTALGEVDDRLAGFEAGADDYLPKPFEPKELVMRLQAILRRTKKAQNHAKAFKVGRWIFDPEQGTLNHGKETTKLTDVELKLINALALYDGEVVSRDELAKLCEVDAGERTIDVQVTRLRRKIEEDTKMPRYLQTVRGKGYLLRIEDV